MRSKFVYEALNDVFKSKSGAEIYKSINERDKLYDEIEASLEEQFGDDLLRFKIRNDVVNFRIDMESLGYSYGPTDYSYFLNDKTLIAESDIPGGELVYERPLEIAEIYDAINSSDGWEEEG
jgi:hypothetical protein